MNAQTSQPLAYLGSGFTGGLAFDVGDGKLYAIVNATDSSTLYAIDAKTYAAQPVGSIETHAYAGLAYAGNQTFYATASDADGKSKLYRIQDLPRVSISAPSTLHWAPDSPEVWRSPCITAAC